MKNIAIISLLMFTMNIQAQQKSEVNRLLPGEYMIGPYLELGTSIATTGVYLNYGFEAFKKNLSIGTDFAMPILNPDFNDVRFRIIKISAELIHINTFSTSLQYNPALMLLNSYTQKMKSWQNEFTLSTGFYGYKWGIGAEFQFNKAYATYIHHTSNYQRFIDSESQAKDGWYKNSASNIKLGINLSRKINNFEFKTSFGIRRTSKFEKYMIGLSNYAEISLAYRLL